MSQDSQLQQSVLAEFAWEPSVTAGHIGVTANDGVVTLSGHDFPIVTEPRAIYTRPVHPQVSQLGAGKPPHSVKKKRYSASRST